MEKEQKQFERLAYKIITPHVEFTDHLDPTDQRTFRLNRAGLETRIRIFANQGIDTSVEQRALAELESELATRGLRALLAALRR